MENMMQSWFTFFYIKLNLSFSPVTCFLTCLRTVDKLCLVDFLQSSVFVNKSFIGM